MRLDKSDKINILLHYDNSVRQDWRFLSRSRLIITSIFLGLQTSLLGWVLANQTLIVQRALKSEILIASFGISFIGVFILGWFGASINKTKIFIVNIEKALCLFDNNKYLSNVPIIDIKYSGWGIRKRWRYGKSVIASIIFSVIILVVLYFLL